MRALSMTNNNQILHDQTRCDEHFLQDRPRMMTRDLIVVTNLLVIVRQPVQA